MKIIITGAGGLVGGRLARHFDGRHSVVALKHAQLDVTDAEAVRRLVLTETPQVVFNCAVMGVDECEHEREAARNLNVEAPRTLATACAEAGAEFVHFSTNYVFDGEQQKLYTAADEARPVNRSEEHTSELQSRSDLVCRLLLEKKKELSQMSFLERPGEANV